MSNDVKDRGLTGAILDALWPILGGSHTAASVWTEIDNAVSDVIARHRLEAALTTPAPAVSRGDQALFDDICDKMEEVLKPLPGELPNALGDAGTRATESGEGDS